MWSCGRAPYFHNGSANSLGDAIDFYDKRFHIGFMDFGFMSLFEYV
jgi:hypothetical protein